MDIDIKDMITLSDDNEYIVVSKTDYKECTYYYLIDSSNNENIKFCAENIENRSLEEVEDKDLIQQLLPLFLKASTSSITKEDIELMQTINDDKQ